MKGEVGGVLPPPNLGEPIFLTAKPGRCDQCTDAQRQVLSLFYRDRHHISTDGYIPYRAAISQQFPYSHHGMLIKTFGEAPKDEQRTYSPAQIISIRKEAIWNTPDMDRVCTSHNERHNGSMRNFIKRMCRLTYCFSKRWENHEAMLGLYFAFFNFCRKHGTLKTTPAVANGLTTRPWTLHELLKKIATF